MIGFVYPEICNQQGDQGYRDWLDANGVATASVGDERIAELTGVVVGDVSERGAAILAESLQNHWLLDEVGKGLTLLAIGRSSKVVADLLDVDSPAGSYKSRFARFEFAGLQIYGYVNGLFDQRQLITESKIGKGRFIQCALTGPVCVVNQSFENYCFGLQTPERDDLVAHYRSLVTD
jgi:hypothetical protein